MPTSTNAHDEGEPQSAFLRVLVEGLSPSLIDDFVVTENERRRAQHCACTRHRAGVENAAGRGGSDDASPPPAPLSASRKKCAACHELRREDIHFGLVSALPELGSWGRRPPLVLREMTRRRGQTSASAAAIAHTISPPSTADMAEDICDETDECSQDPKTPRLYVGYTAVPLNKLLPFQHTGPQIPQSLPSIARQPFVGRLVLLELDTSAAQKASVPVPPDTVAGAAAQAVAAIVDGSAVPLACPQSASVQGHHGAPSAEAVHSATPLPRHGDSRHRPDTTEAPAVANQTADDTASRAAPPVAPNTVPPPPINRILAVENRYTHPDIMSLHLLVIKNAQDASRATTEGHIEKDATATMSCVDVDLSATDLVGLAEINGFLASGTLWEAKLDVKTSTASRDASSPSAEARPVQFTSAQEQFPFLKTLSPCSPSELREAFIRAISGAGGNPNGGADAAPLYQRYTTLLLQPEDLETPLGPMVSLTFFGSDPRLPFDYDAWYARQAPSVQQALAALEQQSAETQGDASSQGRTTPTPGVNPRHTPLIHITDVRPLPLQGSEWCEVDLPTAAPLKKLQKSRQRERLLKQERERQKRLAEKGNEGGVAATDAAPSNASAGSTSATAAAAVVSAAAASRKAAAKPAVPATRSVPPTVSEGIGPSTSRPASPELSVKSALGGESTIEEEYGSGDNGGVDAHWCVRPLRMMGSIRGAGLETKRSQPCWNVVANLSHLGEHALAVTVEVPVLHPRSQKVYWARGEVVIVSSMLRANTSGTMQLPVYCRLSAAFFADKAGTSSSSLNFSASGHQHGSQPQPGRGHSHMNISGGGVWVTLFAQYLVVYAYNHDLNDLRNVRSAESFDRLTIPTLIGHRGLGKTYTRGGEKRALMMKLAENSIESFNAAHRRGCDAIEFDVMLTLDRVPIIFHDPILMLQARERPRDPTIPSRADTEGFFADVDLRSGYASPSANASMVNPSPGPQLPHAMSVAPSGHHHHAGLLTPFQRRYLDIQSFFSPIPVAIHTLTQRQLEVVATEAFRFGKAQDRLKTLLLRHWNRILRVYRNRSRLQCLRDHSIVARPTDTDIFRGCSDIPTGGFVASLDGTAGEMVAAPRPRYADPILGVVPPTSHRARRLSAQAVVKRQEDITNRIPALQELFEFTPTSLRLNIEVKYPFMPKWDVNLFQQTDAFEINGFVDSILDVVFAYAQNEREIVFSSFEPDVCLALSLKQSRYDVMFLSDTEEREDLKDYRSFYVEGALQFAHLHHLSGVSIDAATLCCDAQKAWSSAPTPSVMTKLKEKHIVLETARGSASTPAAGAAMKTGHVTTTASQTQVPLVAELDVLSAVHGDHAADLTQLSTTDRSVCEDYVARWQQFDAELGTQIVSEAHARHLKVFTWGDSNSEHQFAYVQGATMKVDGVITDNVPLWPIQVPREPRDEL